MPDRVVKFRLQKGEIILIAFMLLVYFAQKLFMCRFGIYMEECRDANSHLMALRGMMPYRDFHSWVYGPFSFCVYPLLFKIFGPGLVVMRLGFIAAGSLAVPAVYLLARRLMPPGWALLAAFLSVVLIDVPYYTYNHIFATVAGLCALLFVIKFTETGAVYYLFFSGILTGIAIAAKPFAEGFGTLASILLFLLFVKFQKTSSCRIKLVHPAVVLAGALTVFALFAVYFAVYGGLKELLKHIIPFGPDRSSGFYVYTVQPLSLAWLAAHLKYLISIMPFKALSAGLPLTAAVTESYYYLILYMPVIAPLSIVLLNRYALRKYNMVSQAAAAQLFLFTVFSIMVSAQSLLLFGRMGRSFTMQAPFLLTAYFLFMANNKKLYKARFSKYAVSALSICFVIYLSFLHFFYNPYLRWRTYTDTLPLERAKGIKVTQHEKQMYEGINRFLSENTKPGQPIAVIGYYPQFAFLADRENIFGDTEYIWVVFLLFPPGHDKVREAEDYLISRLELKKPAVIVSPVIPTRKYMTDSLRGYISKGYDLAGVFGPSYIDLYTEGSVYVYKSKD